METHKSPVYWSNSEINETELKWMEIWYEVKRAFLVELINSYWIESLISAADLNWKEALNNRLKF